jgi:hypothetical protein
MRLPLRSATDVIMRNSGKVPCTILDCPGALVHAKT